MAAMFGLCVNAQIWTGNAPAAGEFYLYNVGADKFLCSGNNWGSHASVTEGGIPVTLAGSGTVFSISTASIYDGRFLNEAWMDGGTMDWTFEEVAENVYKLKNGDNVLYWNGSTSTNLSYGADPGTTASQWKLVTEANRIADMATTTEASPINVTFLIKNAYFAKGNDMIVKKDADLSSSPSWKGTSLTNLWGADAGDETANYCPEQYRKTFDNYQELSGIPNGKYIMKAKGFYRNEGGGYAVPYIYANSEKCNLKIKGDDISDLSTAATAFLGTNYLLDGVTVIVTDGNLRVGVKSDAGIDWCAFDDFQLIYYGKCIINEAVELPAGGTMTAGKWYYVDVPSDSEYDLTATTLANIVYTTNATILIENQATVTATFSSTNPVALTAGRYYIKSSTANSFAFEANTKTYTVGDVTATSIADDEYIQSLTTVTFTLGDAATNDGTAALALQGTPVAKLNDGSSDVADGALSISGNVVTATYTSITLDPAKTYTITLPADAVAWDKNTTNKNTEKVITFKTPALFDGTFFIATSDGTQFISRGGNSNTEAILDEFGIAATFTTDATNVTTITFVDNNKHLAGGSQSVYNDKTATELEAEEAGKGARAYWTITANADGYNIYSNKWSKYIGKGAGAEAPNYPTVATYTDTPYKWMLVTPAAHATMVATYKDANAAAVATAANAAGITAVAGKTTVAALKAVIEGAGWVGKDIVVDNSYSSVAEKYQPNGFGEEIFTQNLTGLENGIYKVKLSIFKRIAGNDATYELYQKNQDSPTAYLFAGNNKVQLPSVMSENSPSAYTEGWNPNYEQDGKNYPNSMGAAGQAFDAGRYTLEVFAYVSDGTLSVGVKDPAKYSNSNWICYRDFEVTLYKEFTGDYSALATAISTAESTYTLGFEKDEYAPYTNVETLTALATAKTLNTNQDATSQTEIDAATSALTGATWTANATDVECVYNGNFSIGGWDITGWTRTNGWGAPLPLWNGHSATAETLIAAGATNGTAYYNQPGSMQYGNAGIYTMPLKANTLYTLTFKYASESTNSNNGITASVLNGVDGMAAIAYEENNTMCTEANAFVTKTVTFVTGAAGNYVLTLANSGNTVITDVSLTKAASQVLEFADGSVPSYAPGTYPTVKITRTLAANKWATAVYPFAVSGVDKIAVINSYDAATGALGFTSAAASTANQPFLMRSTAGVSEISLSNVEVAAAAATDAKVDEASLKGVYASTDITSAEKNYVLKDNTIYPIGAAGATISPYRAYIQIDQSSPVKALTFFVDDEATSIDAINGVEAEDGVIYNLAGQRLNKAQKGINIINGKKILK